MELWGGIECTVNRVGDRYFDQLIKNGHHDRSDDLDRFAELGITALRYPVLWERTAPDGLSSANWQWPDERLERLRRLKITPIVGLLHHGSGPISTSLADSTFPNRLADFAYSVASRYPWLTAYTPVNEPLTTARFSGLYGHWYPHKRDDAAFYRMLLNQCRAVVLSMQAIRSINPNAQLIQTEDMGVTYSTAPLNYQAAFENHRRLLSLDLLCGRVDPRHPLWRHMVQAGIKERDLEFFTDTSCEPDIVGLNYYLTSDRLLDDRLERYPAWSHGGNGRDRYADIEAVRVWSEGITGFGQFLWMLWERYGRPLAITEVHLGCTRDQQLLWLNEAWDAANSAKAGGADVRAVTVWSLLGAYDWNRLVIQEAGFYEPGVYDVRGSTPRATALAAMMRSLGSGRRYEHPILQARGWWRLPSRFHYPPVGNDESVGHDGSLQPPTLSMGPAIHMPSRDRRTPILIFGAGGTLGRAFRNSCESRGLTCVALSRGEADIAEAHSVRKAIESHAPWAVINAAGYVRVDDAEAEPHECLRANTDGAAIVAAECAERSIQYLTFSSDLVFDGSQTSPYVESHPVAPLNIYGISKAVAERRVKQLMPSALIVRTSAFFGPCDRANFVFSTIDHLRRGRTVRATSDVVSPTYVPDLVDASLDLLIDKEQGVWHLANKGMVSWSALARKAAELANLDVGLVEDCVADTLCLAAPRPAYSALGSERGCYLPEWEDSLRRYISEFQERQCSV